MPAKSDPEIKRLKTLSPAALADEAGFFKQRTEAVKSECIRRNLKRAEGEFWKISLSAPTMSDRTDRAALLAFLGMEELEFLARFTRPTQVDWTMRCTPKKVLRTAEQPRRRSARRASEAAAADC